jgi:type I restriction enzyme S subunit
VLIRPDGNKISPFFLLYWLLSPSIQNLIHNLTNGATVAHLNLKDIRSFPLGTLPARHEQDRIAAVLSAYDDLIENNTRRIKVLEEMARALYREWFGDSSKKPGSIPTPRGIKKELQRISFVQLADVLSGGTPKTTNQSYWGGDIPFFTPRDAPESAYVFSTEKSLTQAGIDNCSSDLFPPETVFFTARGTVGKVALAGKPMAMNQSCYALRGRAGIDQLYLYLLIQDQVDFLKKNTGGATFDTVIVDTFRRMMVLQPDEEVVRQLAAAIRPIFSQIAVLLVSNNNLRRTRDLLLPKLMSGELDVSRVPLPEEAAQGAEVPRPVARGPVARGPVARGPVEREERAVEASPRAEAEVPKRGRGRPRRVAEGQASLPGMGKRG